MGTYDTYKTDKDKEESGSWVTLADGSSWLISRANSTTARNALERARKNHQSLIRQSERTNRGLPDEVTDEINMNWTVWGLVRDWKGVTGPNGQVLEFNEKNLRMVLTDLPDVHMDIIVASGDAANFQEQMDEEAEGNLQGTSTPN